jgi:tRNA threonylcarbamoyladenosine biosynthesis protein TsaE
MSTSPETVIISRSPAQTRRIAGRLLASLPRRVTLALHGDLGSGKTCFVQGLAEALKITRSVTSPTFIIVNEYKGERPLFHIDLYRLNSPAEAAGVGLDEYVESDGITAIEWAERAAGILPPDTVHISFETAARHSERRIAIRWPAGFSHMAEGDEGR